MSVITRTMVKYLESFAIGLAPSAPLQTCVFHLGQNSINPTQDTTLAQLTECNFDGYAPVTNTQWEGPVNDLTNNTGVEPSVPPIFTCTGSLTVNTVYTIFATGPGTLAQLLSVTTLAPFTPGPGQNFRVTPEVIVSGSMPSCTC